MELPVLLLAAAYLAQLTRAQTQTQTQNSTATTTSTPTPEEGAEEGEPIPLLSLTLRDPSKEHLTSTGTYSYCTFDPNGSGDNFQISILRAPERRVCFGLGSMFARNNDTAMNADANISMHYHDYHVNEEGEKDDSLRYSVTGAQFLNTSADYSQVALEFRKQRQGVAHIDSEDETFANALMEESLVFQVYRSEDCSDAVGQSTSWMWRSCDEDDGDGDDDVQASCDTVPFRMRSFSVRSVVEVQREGDWIRECGSGGWESEGVRIDAVTGGGGVWWLGWVVAVIVVVMVG